MRSTELTLMPVAAAMAVAVQCVSVGESVRVSATTRSPTSGFSGAMRDGRLLSRSSPVVPSAMNRSCQRHTEFL